MDRSFKIFMVVWLWVVLICLVLAFKDAHAGDGVVWSSGNVGVIPAQILNASVHEYEDGEWLVHVDSERGVVLEGGVRLDYFVGYSQIFVDPSPDGFRYLYCWVSFDGKELPPAPCGGVFRIAPGVFQIYPVMVQGPSWAMQVPEYKVCN